MLLINTYIQDCRISYQKGGVRILVASGGSGGHIFPAIALARILKDGYGDLDILFVGTNKELDKRIFEKEHFRFSLLSANKLPYDKNLLRLLSFIIRASFDMIKAFFIIASFRPNVVAGFGGYVSCPVALTANFFRIPVIIHEQNVMPGRANKLLFNLADKIAVSFEETRQFLGQNNSKTAFTGNPIRSDALNNDKTSAIKRLGLDIEKFTILVIGGSQGAHFLNETFINSIASLEGKTRSSLQVIHITGKSDYDFAVSSYGDLGIETRVYSFVDRIDEAYSASDLILSRAGASAIFEMAFFGKPMILVPYPFAMSHQAENAKVFSDKGAAIEIDEKNLSVELLKNTISKLFNDRNSLRSLSESSKRLSVPEAAKNLAEEVLNLA